MSSQYSASAREALAAARQAEVAGTRAGARPAWYSIGLGLALGAAVASFAVPSLTITGVVLGAVIAPIVIATVARRTTGISPVTDLTAPGVRGPVAISVVVVVAAVAAALIHLKTTDEVTGVLVAAVVVAIVTAGCTWWVNSRRREAQDGAGGTR